MYKDNKNVPKIPKDGFCSLHSVATKESLFMFNSKFYKQCDGVAMESPFGPTLAYIYMCSFKGKWPKDCPHGLKSVFYKGYFDDTLILFSPLDYAEKFKENLSKHFNIKVSLEKENDACLSFLDVSSFCKKGKFVTNIYHKKASVLYILISTAFYLKPIKLV